jgi:imidazolonepropionase-like amidohydrolase
MAYDAAISNRILDSDTWVSLTLQAGGYATLVALRHKAEDHELSPDEQQQMSALERYYDMKVAILSRMLDDGMKARIVISSDAGPFDVAFGELQHGLELAASAGMPPIDIIDAVTRLAAEACGILDQVGTLEAGKRADLLLVEGNPIERISDVRRVRQVFLDGNAVVMGPPVGASQPQ